MAGLAYYLLGVVSGVILVFVFFWLVSKNIGKATQQEDKDRQDEWWKRGDDPPY